MSIAAALASPLLKPLGLACCAITALAAAGVAIASRRALRNASAQIAALQANLVHEEGKYDATLSNSHLKL
jgi:hypothetical protein